MERIVAVVLTNAVLATGLALAAALVCLRLRRPAVAHALWLLVLAKLLVPPLWEVRVLPSRPAPEHHAAVSTGDTTLGGRLADLARIAPVEGGRAPAVQLSPTSAATTVWVAGAITVAILAALRVGRFRRLVRDAPPAPPALEAEVRSLAERLGLGRVPAVRIVDARVSPLLWYRPGTLELLLPGALLARLDPAEREALLLHELAHVRRRDHLVRYLELAAIGAFWWHPVVWWARRQLRRFEEQCCDAWVARAQASGGRRSYARALLKTVEFLGRDATATPMLTSGAGEARTLKERLTMIMKDRRPARLTVVQRVALALVALSVLALFPTWIEQAPLAGVAGESEIAEEIEKETIGELDAERRRIVERELRLAQREAERAAVEQGVRRTREEATRRAVAELQAAELDRQLRSAGLRERHEGQIEELVAQVQALSDQIADQRLANAHLRKILAGPLGSDPSARLRRLQVQLAELEDRLAPVQADREVELEALEGSLGGLEEALRELQLEVQRLLGDDC
jgi:beta-lactamase regulating signal transducer with metallopeptidase domain